MDNTEFRAIPGFDPRYVINREGVLVNTDRPTHQIALTPSQRGYWKYSLLDATGQRTVRYRHRLLMLAFKYPPQHPDRLQVNHINGVAGDDRLENLEWCTAKENIRHAFDTGLRVTRYPVEVRTVKDGKVCYFPNAAIAGRAFGMSKDAAYIRCRAGHARVWPDGTQWRLASNEPWYEASEADLVTAKIQYGRKRPIAVWWVFKNEVRVYDGLTEASADCGVKVSALQQRADIPGHPTFPEGYQLKYLDDPTDWNYCDDFWLDIQKNNDNIKVMVAVHTHSKEVLLSVSAIALANKLGVRYGSMIARLKYAEKSAKANRRFGNYDVYYYSDWSRVCSLSDFRVNVL